MAQENDNPIQEEEQKDEALAEAEAKLDSEPSEEENNAPDEAAQEAASVEEKAGANEAMPAEIAAINTDNETATEATEATQENKEENNKQTKGSNMANEKFEKLIAEIEGLTTVELADLVKALEERFGVSAAAPMIAAGAPAQAGAPAAEAEEKANYTLVLADSGAQKIAVIKALREINPELGLKEAKDLADSAPKEIKKDMPKADAEEAKKKIEAAGGKAELK